MSLKFPLRLLTAGVLATVVVGAVSVSSEAADPQSGSYQCVARDVPQVAGTLQLKIAPVAEVKPGDPVKLADASGNFNFPTNSLPAARGWTAANVYLNPGVEVSGRKVTQGDALQAQVPVTAGGLSYQSSFSFNEFSFDTPGVKELTLPASFTVNVTFSDAAKVPTNEFFTCSTSTPAVLGTVTVLGPSPTASPSGSSQPTETVSSSSTAVPVGPSESSVASSAPAAAPDLANTGLTGLWWGAAGFALLLLGAAVVVISRRRSFRLQETKK